MRLPQLQQQAPRGRRGAQALELVGAQVLLARRRGNPGEATGARQDGAVELGEAVG